MATYHSVKDLSSDQQLEVVRLYREAGWWFKSDEGKPALLQHIIAGSHCFCLAIANDEIIGIGRAISDGVCDAYIQDITVRKDCRRRGVGRALMEFIIGLLKRDGLNWIGLIATEDSRSMYEKIGFEVMSGTPMRFAEK
jgi:ribosomal protein S18 acetylase RimI-like enzyme